MTLHVNEPHTGRGGVVVQLCPHETASCQHACTCATPDMPQPGHTATGSLSARRDHLQSRHALESLQLAPGNAQPGRQAPQGHPRSGIVPPPAWLVGVQVHACKAWACCCPCTAPVWGSVRVSAACLATGLR